MTSEPTLPPAQPEYILRGHQSQIHALTFYAANSRLLSADADGYVLSWDMNTKRPVAGWKAHDKAVLGVAAWTDEDLITHGRDNRLVVWRLDMETEQLMRQYVPANQLDKSAAKPTKVQELMVNTMNFCPFAWCDAPPDMVFADITSRQAVKETRKPILLAVSNTLDSECIDIFYMPAATRKSTVSAPKDVKTGMAMAILISTSSNTTVAAGYESGDVIVYQHNVIEDVWKVKYAARPHTQPVLSLCMHPDLRFFISSSADDIIAKHPYGDSDLFAHPKDKPARVIHTKHSGQQGLSMRNDGRLFSSAGWDSKIRIYSAKTLKELAVLKHHKQGCYETALAGTSVLTNGAEGAKLLLVTNSASELSATAPPEKNTVVSKYHHKVRTTHWLAAGSKDGNISLWDVF